MTTIRVGKRHRYTSIDRGALNDRRLSFRARGILAWLLDKPDDWHTNADAIAEVGCEGREAVRTALAELEKAGYLDRRKWRGEDGRWASEWTVLERPKGTEPERETGAGYPRRFPGPLTEDMKLNTDLRESSFAQEPDPDCFVCHGSGRAYYPDAPRADRNDPTPEGPCLCTKPWVPTERDVESREMAGTTSVD